MKRTEISPGVTAWMVIFGGAATFDTWAILTDRESMSSAVWRIGKNPVGRVLMFGLWAGLTYHLFAEQP